MTRRDLLAGNWGRAIEEALTLDPVRCDDSGADEAARAVTALAGSREA